MEKIACTSVADSNIASRLVQGGLVVKRMQIIECPSVAETCPGWVWVKDRVRRPISTIDMLDHRYVND